MTTDQLTYLVFGIVIVVALVFDLGLLSKKNTHITLRKALFQTIFWVSLALGFFGFMWVEEGREKALQYLSAYLMEWSLSIDNIFVFILIFNFFGVKDKFYARVLLIGILMAIIFRVAFITVGIELVQRFQWILYIFGGILVYTGFTLFKAKHDEEADLENNRVYKLIKRALPITPLDGDGKWSMRIDGKKYYTSLFVVVIMLATTDIIFAVDSIPAVFAISQDHLVIYTSNIFAVLGLRSLFFLLKGASSKFSHLQQGIAFVLIFIGVKMLVTWFDIHVPITISLLVIVMSVTVSIVYSISVARKKLAREEEKGLLPEHTPDKDLH
jgi:tellurite resistance protein TerC